MLKKAAPAMILSMLLVTSSAAQQAGQIVGIVRDASGGAVPHAAVTASEAGTGFTQAASTGADGYFVMANLRPTVYVISAVASGFRKFTQSGVQLQANESVTLNITLEVGAVTETVNVAASALQVDTSTSTLSEVVDQARMVELPLNGRDAATLTTLVAGTVLISVSQETGKSIPGSLRLSSNGSSAGQVNFRLDGASNTDFYFQENKTFPMPDALQEFSIQTSNYSAVQGANAGAIVNVVTKSGTNEVHGGAFEFVRNREFNARNFFAAEPDFLKRNQFGAYGGGPVRLPKYDGRNKTFFFIGYQGTRLRNQENARTAFVPTNDELAGNFATCGAPCSKPITDPLNGQPFPGNQIPVGRFAAPSVKLAQNYLPRAVGSGLVFYGRAVSENLDQGIAKIDHQLTTQDRMSVRVFIDHFENAPAFTGNNLLTYRDGSSVRSQGWVINETHTFSPAMLNDFHFGFNRLHSRRGPPPGVPDVTDLGVVMNFQPTPKAINSINTSGFWGFGDNPSAKFVRNGFEWGDRLSWIKGRHGITFGAQIDRQRVDIVNQFLQPGTFTFNGNVTGMSMADFFLGALGQLRQGAGEFKNFRNTYPAFFVQDDIKVTARLTVNLGLRYEPTTVWHEVRGRFERFLFSDYNAGVHSTRFKNAPVGETFRGDPGVPEDGATGDFDNFAPRFGFAWDVFGDGKTSLRGGGGFFYDQHLRGDTNNGGVDASPWSAQAELIQPPGGFVRPYQGFVDPFPAPQANPDSPFPRPVVTTTWAPQYITPLTYNWNLTIERQIGPDWLFRGAYVGSRANHVARDVELDPSVYTPGNGANGKPLSTTANTDARRLVAPAYGSIDLFKQDASGSYHSMQLSLNKRFSRGFTVLANYTLSKSIDDLAGSVMPWYFPNADLMQRGPSDFDHTHRAVVSYVWDLPGRRIRNGLAGRLFHGWQTSGIWQYQSGSPLTIRSGRDNSLTNLGNDRAVLTGVDPAQPTGADPVRQWFNTAAFALNPIGTFGTLGRGRFRGPSLWGWDMGMFKTTQINERFSVQLRGEFFNIFNHPNFGNPQTTVQSGGFGRITSTVQNSAGDPRIIQLGLKLVF